MPTPIVLNINGIDRICEMILPEKDDYMETDTVWYIGKNHPIDEFLFIDEMEPSHEHS